MNTIPEPPKHWHWGLGEASDHYYDRWLYTNAVLYREEDSRGRHHGYEIHIYWDEGGPHYVDLIPIIELRNDGDVEYGYPDTIGEFDTEAEAIEAAIEQAKELR